MSEQERGPYTPPREQPLAFDARGARDARPMPMTLIASGVVLVVLIGGVVMAYVGGGHRKDEPTRTVGDKVATMKTVPAPGQGTPADPAGRMEVFTDRTSASKPPAFAAAPEQPAERPKPQLQVQASTLRPVRIATGDEPAAALPIAKPMTAAAVASAVARPSTPAKPAATKPSATKPSPAASPAMTVAASEPARTVPVKPAADKPIPTTTALALKPALAPKPTTASAAVAGGVGVQIGAFSSKDLADKGYADVGKLASTAGHGKRVEPVAHGSSTLFRTTVTGFASRDAAKSFCETLTAKGHACIVKG